MDYGDWYLANKVLLCSITTNLPELMLQLSGAGLLIGSKKDEIKNTDGEGIQCELLYDHLTRPGPRNIGSIIACLRASKNEGAADLFRGALQVLGPDCNPTATPRDSVIICDLVRRRLEGKEEEKAAALHKWSIVARKMLPEPDREEIERVGGTFDEYVLLVLDKFFYSGRDVCSLLEAIREADMHTLADKIIDERHRMGWSTAFTSRIVCNVGEEVYNFTGREEELMRLHEMLRNAHELGSRSILRNLVCITGLGGVGKTALARIYSLRYFFHGNVIWLNAGKVLSISDSFTQLEAEFGSADGIGQQTVIEKLETSSLRTLFVLDDVEDMDHLQHFPPFLSSPHKWTCKPYVLLTSRRRDLTPLASNRLSLGPLNVDEAVKLIRHTLSEPSDLDAEKLATRLGGLPLTLQQVISHIFVDDDFLAEDESCIDQFLDKFTKSEKALLDDVNFRRFVHDYAETTLATWEKTLSKIRKNQGGDSAMEVLNVLSYLSPVINMDLLGDICPERVNGPVNCLGKFSMISSTRCNDQMQVNIHCLVQSVTRLKLPAEEELRLVQLCAECIWRRLANPLTSLSRGCIPHALHLIPFQGRHRSRLPEDEIASFILSLRGLQVDGIILDGLSELIHAVASLEL